MPQEYVNRLAESPKLEQRRHLVATVQRKIKWRGSQRAPRRLPA